MKTTYTATFSSGAVITRKSNNVYKFAWLNTSSNGHKQSGFSSTKELAAKSAKKESDARDYFQCYGKWNTEIVSI